MTKHLRQIAIWLLVGAVLNIGVALIDWVRHDGVTLAEAQRYLNANGRVLVNFGRLKERCGVPFRSLAASRPDQDRFEQDPAYRAAWVDRPTTPLWPGMIGNTALYAVVGWSLVVGLPAAKRGRRRRPGLCQSCGYDLVGLNGPCPECGGSA